MKKVKVFKNFISRGECSEWISKSRQFTGSYSFEDRVVYITGDPIVDKVKNFLEQKCNCKLKCSEAQIQLWPIGSSSKTHIHNALKREGTDYNSLLYLNDNFNGGEFFTKHLIFEKKIKPEEGMLTFFDGSKVYHGVKKVKNFHRYTLIFWWTNTVFY